MYCFREVVVDPNYSIRRVFFRYLGREHSIAFDDLPTMALQEDYIAYSCRVIDMMAKEIENELKMLN